MKKEKFTYQKSGVNISAADNFVKFISSISSNNKSKKRPNNIGGFGSISSIPKNLKRPKIVACTDGVGTKIEIANILNQYDTIGIDLVAMSVNDLIVQGAKPLLFLDYISINKIDLKKLKSILKGIVRGCKISNCELVGGETAEMPGTYEKGKFDISTFVPTPSVQATILGFLRFFGILVIEPNPPILLNFFLPLFFDEIPDINLTKLSAAFMFTPLFS